ncbi:MAG: ATP-binding protein [Desulfatibacillaceae bacterium]
MPDDQEYSLLKHLCNAGPFAFHKARDVRNRCTVLAKVVDPGDPDPEAEWILEDEFSVCAGLAEPCLLKVRDIVRGDGGNLLAMEDFDGVVLSTGAQGKPLDTESILGILTETALGLDRLHGLGLVHNALCPDSVLVNPENLQVKITGLGRGNQRLVRRLWKGFFPPARAFGGESLTNPRADLFSLGALAVWLLTRGQEIEAEQGPDLDIHSRFLELSESVPSNVQIVVAKLLDSDPERGYRSANGAWLDLRECLLRLSGNGRLPPFRAGSLDTASEIRIPDSAIGREAELSILLASHHKALSGESSVLLFSGDPGVGKTFLVRQFLSKVEPGQAVYGSGKFTPHNQQGPFGSMFGAFRQAIRNAALLPEPRRSEFVRALEECRKTTGPVFDRLFPDAPAMDSGSPVSGPSDDGEQDLGRDVLGFVLKSLSYALAGTGGALVLFMDDLQWSDESTLELLLDMAADPSLRHLLLIGAYRGGEITRDHPVERFAGELARRGARIRDVPLPPLCFEATLRLVSHVMRESEWGVLSVAEWVHGKTKGNPLYVYQFLKAAAESGDVVRDPETGRIGIGLENGLPDQPGGDVHDFIADRIKRMDTDTRDLLLACACAGRRFSRELTGHLLDLSEQDVTNIIRPALQSGLVEADDPERPHLADAFSFVHDRVQQSAYDLQDGARAQKIHLELAGWFEKRLDQDPDYLFRCVHQYNRALDLVEDPAKRRRIAELNLEAAQRARTSAAFESGFEFLCRAMECLPDSPWTEAYELTRETYTLAAEAAARSGRFGLAEQWARTVFENAAAMEDKVTVCSILIRSYIAKAMFQEAMDSCLSAMQALGFNIPPRPGKATALWHYGLALRAVSKLDEHIGDDLPLLEDRAKKSYLKLLLDVLPATYFLRPELGMVILCKAVTICARNGYTAETSAVFACFGFLVCAYFNRLDLGYRMARLALELLDRFEDRRHAPLVTYISNIGPLAWNEPMAERPERLREAALGGMRAGDFQYAAYAAFASSYMGFYSGIPLDRLVVEEERMERRVGFMSQNHMRLCMAALRQNLLNLIHGVDDPTILDGEVYSETDSSDEYLTAGDRVSLANLYLVKFVGAFFFQRYRTALDCFDRAMENYAAIAGTQAYVWCVFYHSVCCLSQVGGKRSARDCLLLRKVRANQKKMRKWAEHAPMNHQYKYDLVEAERARVAGHHDRTEELYDAAIRGARENGFRHDEAVALEFSGNYQLVRGNLEEARRRLSRARFTYAMWGAHAKVLDMDERYKPVFSKPV